MSYRETIRNRSEKIEGKFVRQSGGRGQYGHVVINIEPAEPGAGFVFEDRVKGGVIPREYISSVEQGIKEALDSGVLAGYPVIDLKVELVDGSYHDVDHGHQERSETLSPGPVGAGHGCRGGNALRLYGGYHR